MSASQTINWDEQPLGKVPDRVLAKQLGVPASEVGYARVNRGIPSCMETFSQRFDEIAKPVADQEPTRTKPKQPTRHFDKCPVCTKLKKCKRAACDVRLETADGQPMAYRTCAKCINKLRKETSGKVTYVGGGYDLEV